MGMFKNSTLLASTKSFFAEIGDIALFAGRFFREVFSPPFEFKELVRQCYNIGNRSLGLVVVTGFILGLVFTLQSRPTLEQLITYNGARCMNIQDTYGLEVGKAANFIVLNEGSVYEAIRKRVDVLASVRNGEFLFRRKEMAYDIPLSI